MALPRNQTPRIREGYGFPHGVDTLYFQTNEN